MDEPVERRLAWHATDTLTPIFPDLVRILQCDAAVCASAVNLLSSFFPKHFGIADVAAATGYADQSHLNRHFKTMWGVSPGAFIAGLAPAAKKSR